MVQHATEWVSSNKKPYTETAGQGCRGNSLQTCIILYWRGWLCTQLRISLKGDIYLLGNDDSGHRN